MRLSFGSFFLVLACVAGGIGCGDGSVVGGLHDAASEASPDVATEADVVPFDAPDALDVFDAPEVFDAPKDIASDTSDVVDDVADVPVDTGPTGCLSDGDCTRDPAGNVCDRLTGRCVQCTVANDRCPAAQHCDPVTSMCVSGCRSDEGCVTATGDGGTALRRCDTTQHACVECADDSHCASGRLCRGNVCVIACMATGCPTGELCCAGGCVNVQSNVSSCGACDNVCAVPHAPPACVMGRCAVTTCDSGYADCDGASETGCEVDIRTNSMNCGGCGRACPPAPANSVAGCRLGVCDFTCNPGFGDCDRDPANGCETDLRANLTSCGACTNVCTAPPHGAAACMDGACTLGTCATGFGNCDRNPDNGCETDLNASQNHCGMCGNACPTGQVCNAGRCEVPCPRGLVNCSGECASLMYDPANCGRCGNRCAAGALCGGGSCISTCSAGQVTCSGGCTNTQTDASNCGACGTICPQGNACQMGACRVVCITGQTVCNGACVDLQTNLQNCGSCGNTCGAGEQCMAGRCRLTCRAPQVVCGAECAELSRDPNHCGMCNRACPTGCFEGACARIDTLEAGTFNNCARYTSGRVFCWGLHAASSTFAQGMLTASGDAYGHRATPVQLLEPAGTPLEGVEELAMGSNRGCARLTGGQVRCWGYGVAMGAVSGLPSVTQISGREANFCALGADGQVYCWDGQPRAATAPALTAAVSLAMRATRVVAGGTFSCALLTNRSVQCWGTGTSGQLGNGASVNSLTTPVNVQGVTDAEELVAGQSFACVRRTSGAVQCWGANSDGQLGDNTVTNRNAPVTVMGLTDARLLRAGLRHVCAVRTDGSVQCWGDNAGAQLGDGTTTDRRTPVAVTGLTGTQIRLTAYDHHTCVVNSDRRVFCWGTNTLGEAGGGTELVTSPRPVQYMGADLTGLTDVQVGSGVTTALMATTQWRCALHSDGRVFCWGASNQGNQAGQLGDGTTTQRATPAPVTGITDATQIAVGWLHACALRRNNTVVCWGSNAQGQLGDGTTTNRTTPVAVTGLTNAVEIRAGDYHTCARRMDGSVWCWGYNYYGELGDGTMINRATAAPVMNLTTAVQLEAGANFNCARLMNGEVHCWGRNLEGQLGDGFRTNRTAPYPVQAPTATATVPVAQGGFTDMQCDYYRCYGRTNANTVLGWGWNYPVRASVRAELAAVTFNRRVVTFGEPIDTECEIRTDNLTYCRGRNEFGQVGLGRASFTEASFAPLNERFSVVRLGRGYGTPCGVERTTGRALCWGWAGNSSLLATGATGVTLRASEVVMP